MNGKSENAFIGSVNVLLPIAFELHRERIKGGSHSGIPDMWYSGSGRWSRDLWLEYKVIALPDRASAEINLVDGPDPVISLLQQDWLRRRFLEGRNVGVVVGCSDRGVIFTEREWEKPITVGEFRALLVSTREIAAWITKFVQGQ